MAELQMKLKQFDKAERTVAQALDAENNGQKSDLNSLMTQVGINQYSVDFPPKRNKRDTHKSALIKLLNS